MDALFELNGNVATLSVFEDHCVITGKKTLLGLIAGRAFSGSKEFYYCDLTTVQYKKATILMNGFIQFEYPGANNGTRNFNSENTFVIMKGLTDIEEFEKAYQYIKDRIAYYKQQRNNPTAALSPADELKKFKELLDSGIISQEEFDVKKKELLGF